MTQASNDLVQMKQCVNILSNVYKSQVQDDIIDNGNLTQINNAILAVKNVIRWLETQQQQ